MTTLKELAKKKVEFRKQQDEIIKNHEYSAICREVNNALKNFDFTYYVNGGSIYIGNISENIIDVDGYLWFQIMKNAFDALKFDYLLNSAKDYTTTDVMENLKKAGVIYDYRGSAKEENLMVSLFIDGPRYNPNSLKPATKKKVVVSKKKPITTNK